MGTNCCVCGKKPCETRAVCNALWLEQVRKDEEREQTKPKFGWIQSPITYETFRAAFEAMAQQLDPPPHRHFGFDAAKAPDWTSYSIWGTPRRKKPDHSKADRAAVEAFVASLKPSGGAND